MIENVDYDKIWKEIIEINSAKVRLLPGEKTLEMFAEESGIGIDSARRILRTLIKSGKIKKRFVHLDKKRVNAYSPILPKE